jgi:hypothetical protein
MKIESVIKEGFGAPKNILSFTKKNIQNGQL